MSELDRIVAAYLRKRGYKVRLLAVLTTDVPHQEAAEVLAVQSIDQMASRPSGEVGLNHPMSGLEGDLPDQIEEAYSG